MKNVLTFLLLVSLSVLVKCNDESQTPKTEIKVQPLSGGITVKCPDGYALYKGNNNVTDLVLNYEDSNTGEYECKKDYATEKIFVKFRTCDNCVELDIVSATGLIIGDVVATLVIGVSVYLVAKHAQTGTTTPNKKGSDKQHLVQNEMSNDDGDYQRLRPRNNARDVYDKLMTVNS